MSESPLRPRYRGVLHVVGLLGVGLAAGPLLALADPGKERFGVVVYLFGIASMFGVSALYHRGTWRPKAKQVFQRLDHSTIFLAIAGTYTPIVLLGLRGGLRTAVMGLVWGGATLGIVLQWLPVGPSRVSMAVIYAIVGWSALIALPQLVRALGWATFALVFGGGVSYTVGSVVYARKRPDPRPATFGFHEVFHACTLIGASAHLFAIVRTLGHHR